MLNLPDQLILFDTEYTTWEGAQDRGWSGPGEHKEIVHFERFVRPAVNAQLSEYFIKLTSITQEQVDSVGGSIETALTDFALWSDDLPLFCFGTDGQVIAKQCELASIPCPFSATQFHDIRPIFEQHGIPAREYMSSTIVTAFGLTPTRRGHNALNDARGILDGLVALSQKIVYANNPSTAGLMS